MSSPGRWSVEYERRALRDLRRLDPPVRRRIVAAIDRLAAGDPAADVKRLHGMPLYRLRVGDWLSGALGTPVNAGVFADVTFDLRVGLRVPPAA